MKMGRILVLSVLALLAVVAFSGCVGRPAAVEETVPVVEETAATESPVAAAPTGNADYSSTWLVGKWLSFSSGYLDELVLLKDGTGSSTLYKGSGEPEMAMKLTFDPNVDSFRMDPTGAGVTVPIKYSRSGDGTRLTVHSPDKEIVYAREEQVIREVSGGSDVVQILRLGNYYSVAGDEKCVPLFTEAVKRGESDGNMNLGNYYYKKNKAKAFEYYLKAAEQGNPQAEYNVFVFYFNGEGGVEQDVDKAVTWLIRAAEHGDAQALQVLKQLVGES
jgi:hypothetical protein